MEVNRVSAVYPVIRIKSFSKENQTDSKGKDQNKKREFDKTLMTKKQEGAIVDAKSK
ncbi:MAG: hypothetical protein K0R50_1170 [Eubacterium sp.]|jgi:hypothetical protein|nr:hypothetical protein [Eubacterium sp.]